MIDNDKKHYSWRNIKPKPDTWKLPGSAEKLGDIE